jgi:CHAT domain-containing protein
MRATLGRPGILMLLALAVTTAAGQPVPPPGENAAEPTPTEQKLLDRAKQLDAEGLRYYQRGDLARALAPWQEALAIYRKAYPRGTYPNGHSDLAASISNLGALHRASWQYARAEALYREALAMDRALYPKERFPNGHNNLARSLNNLGALHDDAGEYAKAEPLYREALAMRRALYPKERFPDGHPDLARSINNLGHHYWTARQVAQAEPLFREALAMYRALYPKERYPNGHPALANSINNLGALHEGAGEYAKAEPLYREALRMWRALYPRDRYPNGYPDLAASINNLGLLHERTAAYTRAEPLLREALAMHRALYPPERFPNGHPALAQSINNLGALHRACGEYARAEPLYRAALAMHRALYPKERFPDGHPALADSLHNLGGLYRRAGERARAEPLDREALAMRRALYPRERFPAGHPDLALCIASVGGLLMEAGDHARAEPFLAEALAMYRALYPKGRFPNGHPELATSINNLGELHRVAGAYTKAELLYREALAIHRALYPPERFPNGHPALALTLNNLGGLHLATGDYARAEALYREALAMYRALYPKERFSNGHRGLANSLLNLAALHHLAGEHARAESLFREALAMYGQLLRQFADLAAEAEGRNFASTQSLSRDRFLSNSRHLAQSAAAYEALWDGRAVLTRLQERRHRDLVANADRGTAALADELRRTRRSLARLLLSPGRDVDAHRQVVEQLTQTKEDLEKRIARKLQLAALRPATATSTVQQLGDALPAGAAFVDVLRYVYIEQDPKTPGRKGVKRTASYVAFVVRKGQPAARVELHEAAPIEAAWAAWHKALLAPDGDPKRERAAAGAFARMVWEPIRAALPADCQIVYLTPDGVLTQVPWAALPGKSPGTVLLEDNGVCLMPHGPWLLEGLTGSASGARQSPARTLLAYGGIDYDGAPAAVAKTRSPRDPALVGDGVLPVSVEKRLHWAALPGTAREQEQILALAKKALKAPPIIRSGLAASTDQLLEDLPKARYAHIATHGFFADPQFRSDLQIDPKLYEHGGLGERPSAGSRSPLVLSGLVLTGANRQGEDAAPDHGIITAEGLIGLRLDGLELAVLSACETGLGEVAGGEGVFGLQRAFHIAGARSVVASLWKIDDAATQALMQEFYRNLWERKLPKLDALRRAQLAMLLHYDAKAGRLRSPGVPVPVDPAELAAAREKLRTAGRPPLPPLYWAGFVLSGDWR